MREVRIRSRSGIRQLNFTSGPLPGEAKHDRIALPMTVRIGYHSPEELDEYLSAVADRSWANRPLFLVQSALSVYTRKIAKADGWLFTVSGKLSGFSERDGGVARLALEMSINPTRFLAHHPLGIDLGLLASMSPERALARNPMLAEEVCAATLDGGDDFLLGRDRQGGSSFDHREPWWQRVISIYTGHIGCLFRSSLIPSTTNGLPPVRVAISLFESISQLETYWEMFTGDAISAVHSIADQMGTAAGKVRLRRHFPEAQYADTANDLNSFSVTIPLTSTINICIYAKTYNVVRFEVRYLRDVKNSVARGHVGQTEISFILDNARLDAARRLSRLFEALQTTMPPPTFDREVLLDLMSAIYWATGFNEEAARRLLSPLLNAGGVSETPARGMAPNDVLVQLVTRRVLRRIRVRHGGVARYRLTPAYEAVRRALIGGLPDRIQIDAHRSTAPS